MAQNKTNARSKRVANKKKMANRQKNAANRQKNETCRVSSVKNNPASDGSDEMIANMKNAVMNCLTGDVERFMRSYVPLVARLNCETEDDLADGYPFEALSLFWIKKNLVARYVDAYVYMIIQEETAEHHRKPFFSLASSMIYDVMWLDVCSDNKKVLGSGYNKLVKIAMEKIETYLQMMRETPDYVKFGIPKPVFEWVDKTHGTDYCKLLMKNAA